MVLNSVEWIYVVENRNRWRAVVNTAVTLRDVSWLADHLSALCTLSTVWMEGLRKPGGAKCFLHPLHLVATSGTKNCWKSGRVQHLLKNSADSKARLPEAKWHSLVVVVIVAASIAAIIVAVAVTVAVAELELRTQMCVPRCSCCWQFVYNLS